MTYNKKDFAKDAISRFALNKESSLNIAPIEFKVAKPKTKPKPKVSKTTEEEEEEIPEYENPFQEFVKTWNQGDPLPLVPPGMKYHFCKFAVNNLDTDAEYLGLEEQYRKPNKKKIKEKSSFFDIEIKNLGPQLRNTLETVRQRSLNRRGGLVPWVDDNNKLRCPAGTPAANQFTDNMMSNCFILSPETVAGVGKRAIRRAGAAADILSAKPGGRVETPTVPGDVDVSTPEGIRKLGPVGVQAYMAPGGRVAAPTGVAGAMGAGFGFRADPKNRSAKKAFHPGVKEQLERGRRATRLSDEIHRRIMNPSAPDGIRLPSGAAVGDLRNKDNFMRAMREMFPNVDPAEIESMFDNAMPNQLGLLDQEKYRKFLVRFYEGVIAEAIADPYKFKWVTKMGVDASMKDAVQISLEPFAPGITTGGRYASAAAIRDAQKAGNLANGGSHFSFMINPMQLWLASRGFGHTRNGRASGISDSERGMALYIATHEVGHIAHFSEVMTAMGLDNATLPRYVMNRSLTPGSASGPPSWSPNREVGGWQIDWANIQNPMGSPSIDALKTAAQNLQTRNYSGGAYRGRRYGYNRMELEKDLNDFYVGFQEAVHNNITDTPEDVELMRAFAGGEYAATNSIEARAEYYSARRLFGETEDARERLRPFSPTRQGSSVGRKNPAYMQNYVESFSQSWSARPANIGPGGAPIQTPRDIYDDLDRIGQQISGIRPGSWNKVSGFMTTGNENRQTLYARSVARAVRSNERLSDPNSAQFRRGVVSGSMTTAGSVKGENSLSTITPSLPAPLGEISPERREAGRSAKIIQEASKVNGVAWSNPVPVEEVKKARDRATFNLVERFEIHKRDFENGVPSLTSLQSRWLQNDVVANKRDLTDKDIDTILRNESWNFGLRTAVIREHAKLSGDNAKVEKIDRFVDTIRNMTKDDFEEMIPSILAGKTSKADKRVHVMMNNPVLLETTGRYLTVHDKEERAALGVGFTGFANAEFTIDVRKGIEQSFGIPFKDDEEVRKLRPASGFMPHSDSHLQRTENLRAQYGSDTQIMHPYAMGTNALSNNGVEKYGSNLVILRSEVAERSKVMRGDSAADRDARGNAILPISEMVQPENQVILNQNAGASLLWDEIVGRGGLNSSTNRQYYNEAVVLGSFNLKDDVEALVVSPGNFDLEADELAELDIGRNARNSNPNNMPTKLIQAARFRDRMRTQHGIDVVVGLPKDPVNPFGNEFSIDEVELFNPQMTRTWMSKNFPDADLEKVIPDSKTTPYEAFIRYISKDFDSQSASGKIIRLEIERLDELKLRTYGEADLGQSTQADKIDSRGMELLPSAIRRSISGKMSTQRITPDKMVEVPEIQKRGVSENKQRLSDAESRVARLEEGLRILEETGEWRGEQLGAIVSMTDNTALDSIDNQDIKPNNKTRAEIDAIDGGIEGFKEKIKKKILTSKKEVELRKFLAEGKQTRVKQNVLDLEDISPEELEVLKEEGRKIRELMQKDIASFQALVSSSGKNRQFVIHAGSSELEGGVLNSDRTVGTNSGSLRGNTQMLNVDSMSTFIANYNQEAKLVEVAPKVLEKLKSRKAFTIDSNEELSILSDVGVTDVQTKIGDTVDLPLRYGENYDSGLEALLKRFEINKSGREKTVAKKRKTIKVLEDNPRSGFLSSSPVYDGQFSSGYFGRYSDLSIPEDVKDVRTEQESATTGERTSVRDDFMYQRWMDNLRGTAWLIEGENDSQISSSLGPNWERQILGVAKPDFGFSAKRNDSYVVDEVGFAVMVRAMQLKKEGKPVTPGEVLNYRKGVSGKMSTVSAPQNPAVVGKRIDGSVENAKSDIDVSTQKLKDLEQALKVLGETGEWRGAEFGVTPYDSNNWFGVGFDDPDFQPENLSAEDLASGRFGGVDKLKESVAKKVKETEKYIRIQKDLAQRKAIRREQNVLDVEDISDDEYSELLSEAEYIKSLDPSSDEYKEIFGPAGNVYFVQHAGSSELRGGVLNPALSVGSTQINPTSGGDTRGVNNLARYRIDQNVKVFETDLSELMNLKKWADSNPSGGTYTPSIGTFGSNSRSLSRNGYGQMDNDELVVSADRVAFLKEKVDKDMAELNEKLERGQFFLKKLDENDGQHLSAYPAGEEVSTNGLGYFASQANSEIPEDIGIFPTQFQENNGVSQRTRDQSAADNWKASRRGTLWLVAGEYNKDITNGFAGMANSPGDERQILGTQKPMFGVSQLVNSDSIDSSSFQSIGRKGLAKIGPALVARAIKLKKGRKDVSPESVLSSPLRTSISGAMSTGETPVRPKYPRTPTYGVAIGKGDDLFASAESWKEFKRIYGDREVVFLDYETTGLVFDEFGKATSNGAPVQIGAVKWKDGKVSDRFNVYINPGEKLGEWSRDNLKDKDGNPLTDDWLSGQPSIANAHKQLAEFAGPDAIMGVQNASFDKNVLDDALKAAGIEWTPAGYIDTKEISSMVLPRWTPENPDGPAKMGADGVKRPSNGLKEITEYLGVNLGEKHHTADADAEATAEVMQKIIDKSIENGWSDRIFSKSTRQAHIDKVNQKHLQEIEEFKKARDAFLAEVERLATKRDDGSAKNPLSEKTAGEQRKSLIDNPYNKKVARAFKSVEKLGKRRIPNTH